MLLNNELERKSEEVVMAQFGCCLSIMLDRLKETMKTSHYSSIPGQDYNLVPSKQAAGLLSI
jgi:hypothetical protein